MGIRFDLRLVILGGALAVFGAFGSVPGAYACYECNSSEDEDAAVSATKTTARTTTQSTVRAISSSISSSVSGAIAGAVRISPTPGSAPGGAAPSKTKVKGVSGGDDGLALSSLWGTFDVLKVNVTPDGNRDQERKTLVGTLLAGGDAEVSDGVFVGMSLGYSMGDTFGEDRTAGWFGQGNEAFIFAPYAAYIINDNFYADGQIGYISGRMKTTNFSAANAVTSQSKQDSTTKFIAAHLNYVRNVDGIDWGAVFGYSWMMNDGEDYTRTDGTNIAGYHTTHYQFTLGGSVSYLYNIGETTYRPYGKAVYERDGNIKGIGENGLRLIAGVDWAANDNLTFALEANKLLLKQDQKEWGASLNLRYAF